ncbi:MAG: flagellar protein FlaG [Brevundimonas sp.]|jgi:flagellar protein FlaG|uniref:flagellar protein FlaG n=1 Tax=Brevundimonas sp. TaxID=1871086 RepID=UPI001A20C26C|nr:flagellar protein FlaG [Brevundimonas sp.]MBJ7448376.1 flagellar protein FlaG [Brevundimonas sp.]
MSNNAAIAAVTATAVLPIAGGSSASGDFNGSKSAQDVAKAARYRLVIEEGPQNGSFIYKTMDRETGEVIRQFPREQVVKMMQSESYGAGSVIDTTA